MSHLLVYQLRRKGRDERWVLISGRVVPHDLKDDVHVVERYGEGHYRIDARNEFGKLCGSPHYVSAPDENGDVPIPPMRGAEDEAGPAPDGGMATMQSMMLKFMQTIIETQRAEIQRIRDDHKANLDAFGSIVDRVLTAQSVTRNAGGGTESAFLQHALARMEKLGERVEKLNSENLKLQVEAASKKKGGGGSFADMLADKALPKLFEMWMEGRETSGGGRAGTEARAARMREMRNQPKRAAPEQRAPSGDTPAPQAGDEAAPQAGAGDEDAATGEVVYPEPLPLEEIKRKLEAEGIPLPPLEEVMEHLADPRNTLSPRDLRYLRQMRAEGLLPADYLAVLKPFLDG